VAFDAVNSRQYYLENTFLYVDEVGHGGEGLCLAPSSPEPCPLGFVASDPSAASCALEARNNGIYTVDLNNDPSNPYQVTLNSKTGEIECWVLGSRLYRHGWGLYSQCKACLDIPQPASIDSLVSKWRGVNAWAGASVFVMAYSFSLPGASCWKASSYMLTYIMLFSGSCDQMSCSGNTYEWQTACIPCMATDDDWSHVCQSQVFDRRALLSMLSITQYCCP